MVWLLFAGRRARLITFCITTPLQVGIIVTANYAFLNYIVLALGFLLVEDRPVPATAPRPVRRLQLVALPLIFTFSILMFLAPSPFLAQFRIVNNYGLFAIMTRARYEIEFQGTRDGRTWIAYPFRHKPQDPKHRPDIHAPYQPRFDWNLWFASLGDPSSDPWVMSVQQRLLENDRDVLTLFAGNPFATHPPIAVRTVRWQYWFTTREEHARTGAWWNRRLLGEYGPVVRARKASELGR